LRAAGESAVAAEVRMLDGAAASAAVLLAEAGA
jgi:hypothetical protein